MQVDLYVDDRTITCSADNKSMHKLESGLNKSVAKILNWDLSNKLPINVVKTNAMIVTGKRLETKLDFQPSVKCSDHELVSNKYIHTYIHSLFDNAGYRIRKTEVLMWTCLSTI